MAGVAIVMLVGAIIWGISFSPLRFVPFSLAGQAYAMIAMVLAFRYWPPILRLVASMPAAHRVVFGVLIGGMILGHYTLNGRSFYPFIVWEIFPHAAEPCETVNAHEFIATTANGTKVRLIAERLFPSLVQIDRVETMTPALSEKLARVLAKKYNEFHADNPVRQVDLMNMVVQLHPPANESRAEPSCELLKHYDVSSDR
jgi:hypothetical protein